MIENREGAKNRRRLLALSALGLAVGCVVVLMLSLWAESGQARQVAEYTANGRFDAPQSSSVGLSGATLTATSTPLGTPVLCPPEFQDVPPSHPDYAYIHCVACQGSMDNFPCGQSGEPCVPPDNYPYFRPDDFYVGTRAEICKLLVIAARWPIDTSGGPRFPDVPVCSSYYAYIETAVNRGIISGYSDGLFYPNRLMIRGQFAKLLVLTAGWTIECPPDGHFTDVPPNHPFYCYIETAYLHGVMDGYPDSTFRPDNNLNTMTRAEIARIIARAFANCVANTTPTPTIIPCPPTFTSTSTSTYTNTPTITPTYTPTHTPCNPSCTPTTTRTHTLTPTITPTPCRGDYVYTESTGVIVPGTTDIGNHCDDCTTVISLPFPYQLYDQTFISAVISSNGVLQFLSDSTEWRNTCPPTPTFDYAIMAHWADLFTEDVANGQGVFTSVSGSAPNRIFNIEWRAQFCCSGGAPVVNVEIRLHEGQTGFDLLYGQVSGTGNAATVAVQGNGGSNFTLYECNTGGLTPGLIVSFALRVCGTITPTHAPCNPSCTPTTTRTSTSTSTRTRTPTATLTPCGPLDGTWSQQAPIPMPVYFAAVVSHNGFIYSFGGSNNWSVSYAYKYDPVANVWTSISWLPAARAGAAAVSDGTYIYIVGGRDFGGNYTNTLYRYNPATNSYTSLAPYSIGTFGHAAVYHNGKIYRIGGYTNNPYSTRTMEVYSISTDIWTFAASYSFNVSWLSAVAIGNYVYTAGGYYNAFYATNKTYRYDPVSNSWDDYAIADLPYSTDDNASDLYQGMWILAGGSGIKNQVTAWYPVGNYWIMLPSTSQAWGSSRAAATSQGFYTIGGLDPIPHLPTADVLRYVGEPCFIPSPTRTPCGLACTPTLTPTPNITLTFSPSASPRRTATSSHTRTYTPTPTSTSTPTITTSPTVTLTRTNTSTNTPGTAPTFTHTNTPTSANTPIITVTSTNTSTPCSITFTDVHPTDYFYVAVRHLYCAGVISGYADDTFRPYNETTRGQLTKIVVLALGWEVECSETGHFTDVPPDHAFYCFVETAYAHEVISGYADGTFRPGNNITRGQLCKIIQLSFNWPDNLLGAPHFMDVPDTHPFYRNIETCYNYLVISGYSDGTFRPGNSATRGQICKIVYQAMMQP